MATGQIIPESKNLSSVLQGFYDRVATRLNVDPSYVSRVARGERQSEEIESALEHEMRQIVQRLRGNHNGSGRHAAPEEVETRSRVGNNGNEKNRSINP